MMRLFVWIVLFALTRQNIILKRPFEKNPLSGIDRWTLSGSTKIMNDRIRLTTARESLKGSLFAKEPNKDLEWDVSVQFSIENGGVVGADGLAFWYVKEPSVEGTVYGYKDKWEGLAIIVDTYDNNNDGKSPFVFAIVNNGTITYDNDNDGTTQALGGCQCNVRRIPGKMDRIAPDQSKDTDLEKLPVLHATYSSSAGTLTVSISPSTLLQDSSLHNGTSKALCFAIKDVHLPLGYFFGVSAATGGHSDNHDIIGIEINGSDKANSNNAAVPTPTPIPTPTLTPTPAPTPTSPPPATPPAAAPTPTPTPTPTSTATPTPTPTPPAAAPTPTPTPTPTPSTPPATPTPTPPPPPPGLSNPSGVTPPPGVALGVIPPLPPPPPPPPPPLSADMVNANRRIESIVVTLGTVQQAYDSLRTALDAPAVQTFIKTNQNQKRAEAEATGKKDSITHVDLQRELDSIKDELNKGKEKLSIGDVLPVLSQRMDTLSSAVDAAEAGTIELRNKVQSYFTRGAKMYYTQATLLRDVANRLSSILNQAFGMVQHMVQNHFRVLVGLTQVVVLWALVYWISTFKKKKRKY